MGHEGRGLRPDDYLACIALVRVTQRALFCGH